MYITKKIIEERAIHISSVNREKRGTSRPSDFTIKFNLPLKLDSEMKHELALDRLLMTYAWYNIRSDYGNNTVKYTHDKGVSWQTIPMTGGMYSYSDIEDYVHQYVEQNHKTTGSDGKDKFHINLTFILSTYRVLISFDDLI